MQMSISECIRQLRRQQGMTQTELGAEHFSKSYVSAVEREKIVPSYEALRFFAEQLNQSYEYFKQLAEQPALLSTHSTQAASSLSFFDENDEQDDSDALLDMVLEGIDLPAASFTQEISTLSLETLMHLPLRKQARYCLVKGLILQGKGDFAGAHPLLERALALSVLKNQPAILDALGTNAALAHTYQTALSYHQRALDLLTSDETEGKALSLLLKVELHCGDDYRALGIPAKALSHYESARQSLRSTTNMDIAGQVYMGLGYCTYASIYQNPGAPQFSSTEKERLLQRATSFLLQSRTLYQISSNRMGESQARVLHTIVLLAICSLRRQLGMEQAHSEQKIQSLNCATPLDEAEEQCRQVLLSWNEFLQENNQSSPALDVVLYSALSSLVNVTILRATVARLEGYSDTALRNRARAAHLCQRILDTLVTPELLLSLITGTLQVNDTDIYRVQALPRLPSFTQNNLVHNPINLTAIFSAAGEVAEELGRTATTLDYASACYTHANECFKSALNSEYQITFSKEHDISFLTRSYQHYVALLEERMQVAPDFSEEVHRTIQDLFKESLSSYTPQAF